MNTDFNFKIPAEHLANLTMPQIVGAFHAMGIRIEFRLEPICQPNKRQWSDFVSSLSNDPFLKESDFHPEQMTKPTKKRAKQKKSDGASK